MGYLETNQQNIGTLLESLESKPAGVQFKQGGKVVLLGLGHSTEDNRAVDACIARESDRSFAACFGRLQLAYDQSTRRQRGIKVTFQITAGDACKRAGNVSTELKKEVIAAMQANEEKINQRYLPSEDFEQNILWEVKV